MRPTRVPRAPLAVAVPCATALPLPGCTFVGVERGGGCHRRPPPGYYGHYRGGPYPRW